ncbi:MAG: outer membrane lipoprotein-sorting protein [Burkholderiales bacterium]|nr:outer membrane lipoprotein-sorting protein [Burkholderiales bacterium]
MVTAPGRAADPSADEIVTRSLEAFYYAGNDMRAKVQMKLINPQGKVREREMTMLRINLGKSGDQRYYLYFHGPADVKGTSFLVWKYPAKEDDRWIFVPTLKLVKRIAADDKRSSFVGSDFTYEDVSGRDLDDETHALVRKENLGGRPTYVVEGKPKASADYSRRLSWIDSERWLPLREEYLDARNEPLRTFTADKVEQTGKYWTVTARSMKNLQSGHRTEVVYREVEYDVGLKQDIFTERYLRDAPSQWVR